MSISQTIPFGNYQPTWTEREVQVKENIPSRIFMRGLVKSVLQYSIAVSSVSGYGYDPEDVVSNTINTSTIETAFLILHEYFNIRFPSCDSTINYILQHQDIYYIILYACISTEECFGERAQISLELYRDPEIKDEYLTIYVRQNAYESNLIDTIDKLSKKFEEVLGEEENWFLITTDFNPPME